MDSEWDQCCPVCITPFTDQDRQFRPCKCSFRMCLWCWHTIVTLAKSEHQDGTCPQCRGLYDMAAIQAQQVRLAKPRASRKAVAVRSHLANVVVNDKRVVAVRNIPAWLIDGGHHAGESTQDSMGSSEAVAASPEQRVEAVTQHFLFGQYGRIVGAVVVRARERNASYVYHAAIRYSATEEAARCVRHVDHSILCGHVLTCTQVPTRYCSQFLLKTLCTKKMCVELHRENTNKSFVVAGQAASGLNLLGPPVQSMWLGNSEDGAGGASALDDPVSLVSTRTLDLANAWIAKTAASLMQPAHGSLEGEDDTCGGSFDRQRTDASVASWGTPLSMPHRGGTTWGGDSKTACGGENLAVQTTPPMVSNGTPALYDRALQCRVVTEGAHCIAVLRKKLTATQRAKVGDGADDAAFPASPDAMLSALCAAMPPNVPASAMHAALPHPAGASKRK